MTPGQRAPDADRPDQASSRTLTGWSLGTVAVLCVTAGVLAACGQKGAPHATVSVVPATTDQGHTWQWTAACPFRPVRAGGCGASAPILRFAELSGDEWNLGGAPANGSVRMTVGSSGSVTVQGALDAAPPCTDSTCIAPSAGTWVRGYPSVLYGVDQCNASTSPPRAPALALPIRVGSLRPDLIGTTTYSSIARHVTFDIAYDMWLNSSDTETPCTTGGTVEVMVWTDYDDRALLPQSLLVGTASVPYAVNGRTHLGQHAWSIFATNVYRGGQTAPWGGTVWLVLDQAALISRGTVRVDLSTALSAVGTLLQDNYGWTDFSRNYWLDTIPFGIEFGPQDASPASAGASAFSLNISSYCLDVGATLSDAAC